MGRRDERGDFLKIHKMDVDWGVGSQKGESRGRFRQETQGGDKSQADVGDM